MERRRCHRHTSVANDEVRHVGRCKGDGPAARRLWPRRPDHRNPPVPDSFVAAWRSRFAAVKERSANFAERGELGAAVTIMLEVASSSISGRVGGLRPAAAVSPRSSTSSRSAGGRRDRAPRLADRGLVGVDAPITALLASSPERQGRGRPHAIRHAIAGLTTAARLRHVRLGAMTLRGGGAVVGARHASLSRERVRLPRRRVIPRVRLAVRRSSPGPSAPTSTSASTRRRRAHRRLHHRASSGVGPPETAATRPASATWHAP